MANFTSIPRLFLYLFAFCFSLVVWFSFKEVMVGFDIPVERAKVSGYMQNFDRKLFEEVVIEHMRQGFFSLKSAQLKKDLQALPWVQDVEVRKQWPDQLSIFMMERVAVAYWAQMNLQDTAVPGRLLVGADGQLFQSAFAPRVEMPMLFSNLQTPQSMWQTFQQFSSLVSPHELQISALEQDEQGNWQIKFTNAIELLLGKSDIQQRLLRFAHVYSSKLKHRDDVVLVDARYSNGVAVSTQLQISRANGM